MYGEVNVDPEVARLVELGRELSVRRVNVALSDAFPALLVNTSFPGVRLHVYVSCSGGSFTWQRAENRHPVDDPSGAAERIAAYVRLWNAVPGNGGNAGGRPNDGQRPR